MRSLGGLLALFAAGCGCAGAPDVSDAGLLDAAANDAGRDAPIVPATDSAVDAAFVRPDWLPSLTPACGAASYDVDDPATYDTRPELARAIAEARCAYGIRCSTFDVIYACDPIAISDGLYVSDIDPVLAADCLRSWEDADCDPTASAPPALACAELERGRTRPGQPCTHYDDCAGFCRNETGATCGGTCDAAAPFPCSPPCALGEVCTGAGCRPPVAIGAPCDATRPCEAGARCEGDVCLAYPGASQPCVVISGPITATFCGPGLLCDRDFICRPPRVAAIGEPCGGAASCAPDAYCATVCRAPGTEVGDPCVPALAPVGATPRCIAPLYCASSGTCQMRHASGAPCDAEDACASATDHCLVDYDTGATRTCAHYVAAGCACDATTMCTPEHECHDGICARRGTFTRACTTDADCARAGTCREGACVSHFIGEPCGPGDVCFEGRCSAHWCVPLRENGQACRSDFDCARPETCESGRCHSNLEDAVCPPAVPP